MAKRRNDIPPEIDFAEGYSLNSTLLEEFRQRQHSSDDTFRRQRQSVDQDARRQRQSGIHAHKGASDSLGFPDNGYWEDSFPDDSPDIKERPGGDAPDLPDFFPETYTASPMPPETKKKGAGRAFWVTVLLLIAAIAVAYAVRSIRTKNDGLPQETNAGAVVTNSDASHPEQNPDSSGDVSSVESTASEAESQPEYKELKPGDNLPEVKQMQLRLYQLGYMDKSNCTGFYGDFTEKTVKLFQSKVKLKKTGIADSKTLERLYADDAPYCR